MGVKGMDSDWLILLNQSSSTFMTVRGIKDLVWGLEFLQS